MNGITQNDLSGSIVRLDYRAMLNTACYAYRELLQAIRRRLDYLAVCEAKNDHIGRYMQADQLAKEAAELATTADTLSALLAGCERPTKELVNVPDVPEEE